MMRVGPSGAAVSSSDGKLAVNIPAGALTGDVTITTEAAPAPAAGAVGYGVRDRSDRDAESPCP